ICIAGEDDLDAPDLNGRSQPRGGDSGKSVDAAAAQKSRRPAGNGKDPGRSILDTDASAALRDQLIREVTRLESVEDAAQWARAAYAAKNTLTPSDSRLLGVAFELRLSVIPGPGSAAPRPRSGNGTGVV